MRYLLDTNVISELRKGADRCDAHVRRWFEHAASGADLYLSVLVLGELRQGIERIRDRDRAQAQALEGWLNRTEGAYGPRILPITVEIAQRYGRAQARKAFPVIDALMAATADEHGLQLVTRDLGDLEGWPFAHIPVNPFEPTLHG